MIHFEMRLILFPLCSVLSVYSVVLACKITTEYTESTEKTFKVNHNRRMLRTVVFALLELSTLSFPVAAQNAGKAAEIYNKALELQQAGDTQNALAAYDRAIALNPKILDAHNNRATIKLAAGDSAGAIADRTNGLRKIIDVLMNRAGALEQIDKAAAVNDYTKVIELNPENAQAYAARCVAILELGKKPAAVADLREALQMDLTLRANYESHLKEALR